MALIQIVKRSQKQSLDFPEEEILPVDKVLACDWQFQPF